jgi:hypothetical protein
MRIDKSGHEIRSVEDWFRYAPPKMGERQWKDGRSAKELARSWFRKEVACPPEEMRLLLERAFRTEIAFDEAEPECIIELDDFAGEHRNCDLVVLCKAGTQLVAINIEAKADEPFGDTTVGDYYDQKADFPSHVPVRIRQLSLALFGREPDEAIRRLRYQLLHAAAATLIEAAANEAELGLFLVHEFRSATLNGNKLKQNAADWQNFVHAFPELAAAQIEKNQILGPVSVPGGGARAEFCAALSRETGYRARVDHCRRDSVSAYRVLPVRKMIVTTTLLLVVAASALAQNTAAQSPKQPTRPGNGIPTRQSDADNVGATGAPCLFDAERGEVPNCLRKNAAGELFIAPQFLKELPFDAHGLAAVLSPREGWMYVNRRGKVVITGVPVMDNWADSFHDGLVRIVRNGKYGFANRKGQVVIPPIYGGAMNFEKGRATVCKGCESKRAEPECEHHVLAGGEWFRINTKGTVLTRLRQNN